MATVFYTGTTEIAVLGQTYTVSGSPADPSTVTCVVTDPLGAQTTYTVTAGQISKTATGVYTLSVPCPTEGLWSYVWVGTGLATDVTAGTWTALPTNLSNLYCSLEEVKSRLGIDDTDADFEVAIAVQAAAREVEGITHRYFWRGAATRTYVPHSNNILEIDDLVSIDTGGLKTDPDGNNTWPETWTAADFELATGAGEYNATARGESWPYTQIHAVSGAKWFPCYRWPFSRQDRVKVTGTFGWPAVPPAVKQAALLMAVDLYKSKETPYGIAGFDQFGAVRIGQPYQVMKLLQRYVRGGRKVGV